MALPLALAAAGVHAQAYPARSIRLIVPFPPGGPNDVLGRVVALKLTEQMGQQVVVDNRGGAGGIIGAELAARANPDGYTLFFGGTASMSINPALHKKLSYDPIADFAAVSLIGTAPSLLTLNPSLPMRSVKDLIEVARAKPGQLTFASSGVGTAPHLAGELFNTMAGVNLVHVPYRGGGPAFVDLMAGQVAIYFAGISAALPFVKEGKLRAIAVTGAQRTAVMPEMPTIAESGLPGFEVSNWYAIVTPVATPRAVIVRLNGELVRALATEDMKRRFLELGADPIGSDPDRLAAYIRSEMPKWAKVIRSAGLKAE
ncbi:MAG: tripartite tricarboxylate transporter substrate binding protein [Burkholderiales bacterium]